MIDQATYLLPIRSAEPHAEELSAYLRSLAAHIRVVIVDDSPADVFDRVHVDWAQIATHVRPDPHFVGVNGKVRGVLSGAAHVLTPFVIIADDDVRHTRASLVACVEGLCGHDLLVPQNYFSPVPWHAVWDTARTLLNRSFGRDFPGTMGVRIEHVVAGYDADVLFENLELIRTVEARGGSCVWRPDIYVLRIPPTSAHFIAQRVRQAYDEFARPMRMMLWLLLLPSAVVATVAGHTRAIVVIGVGSVASAEIGRRRYGGRGWFSPLASLAAPLWLIERSVCVWLAVFARRRGGVRYVGGRIHRAANSRRRLAHSQQVQLRQRTRGSSSSAT